jgi:hypothetical protein
MAISNIVNGAITAANVNQFGPAAATANSTVVINCDENTTAVSVSISSFSSYTSGANNTQKGIIAQGTINGSDWTTIEKFIQVGHISEKVNVWRSNINSAQIGTWLIPNSGFKQIRVTSTNFAFTGTAIIDMLTTSTPLPTNVAYDVYQQKMNGVIGVNSLVGVNNFIGSNTKDIIVRDFGISMNTSTVAATNTYSTNFQISRATSTTVGTLFASTTSKNDNKSPAPTNSPTYHSSAGTITGGVLLQQLYYCTPYNPNAGAIQQQLVKLTPFFPFTLRGTSEIMFVSNQNGGGLTVSQLSLYLEWAEY